MKKPATRKPTSPAMVAPDRKYMVEDAARTLKRAAEIKADPALMKEVQAHAQTEIGHLKKIARGSKL